MENFRVWKGKKTEIPSEIVNGRIYFTTDTQELLVDTNGERKEYTASKLTTPRTINGTEFDGTKNINTKYSYNIYNYGDTLNNYVTLFSHSHKNNSKRGYCSFIITGMGAIDTNPAMYFVNYNYNSGATVYQLTTTTFSHLVFGYYITNQDGEQIYNFYYKYETNAATTSGFTITVLANSNYGAQKPATFSTQINTTVSGETVEIPVRKLLANGEVNAASDLTGILPVANGGTGNATGTAINTNYVVPQKIPNNTNLDVFTDTGFFYCDTVEGAQSISGLPTGFSEPFSLYINIANGNNTVTIRGGGRTQLLLSLSGHMYYRTSSYNSDFSSWITIYNSKYPQPTVSKLTIPRTINGTPFDGTQDINTKYSYNFMFENKHKTYSTFAKIPKGYDSTSCILVADLGNIAANSGGLWSISIHLVSGSAFASFCEITEIQPPINSNKISFGTYSDEDYVYLGFYVNGNRGGCGVTVLSSMSSYSNFGIIAESTNIPTGWTEIPQRILQDAEQVTAKIHKVMPESSDAAVTHRNIFRGKNLGSSFTAAQKAVISSGTFDDLYVGDYWVIAGVTWRIVDIDYWWNCGDTACTTHHLVIMPDSNLYNAQMNETNTTTGGYVGSKMYTTNLTNAKTTINTAFGSANILTHRDMLVNAVTDGYPSAGAWLNSTVELPNEIMMYGSYVHMPAGDGVVVPHRYTINKTQLALMRLHPKFIQPNRARFWLRDVVSAVCFAGAGGNNYAEYYNASISVGVRPVFGIIGT